MNVPWAFSRKKKTINAIIETPRNSRYKYTYDPKLKLFRLGKMLPAGMEFPLDMGFIPGTKGEDGDPLDILVLMEHSTYQGCMIECRLLGIIRATQKKLHKKEIRNDRIIGVPENSVEYSNIFSLDDLDKHKLNDIIHFFEFYNKVEKKKFKAEGIASPDKAFSIIKKSVQ